MRNKQRAIPCSGQTLGSIGARHGNRMSRAAIENDNQEREPHSQSKRPKGTYSAKVLVSAAGDHLQARRRRGTFACCNREFFLGSRRIVSRVDTQFRSCDPGQHRLYTERLRGSIIWCFVPRPPGTRCGRLDRGHVSAGFNQPVPTLGADQQVPFEDRQFGLRQRSLAYCSRSSSLMCATKPR